MTAHLRKNMYDVLRTVEVEEGGGQCADTVRRAAHIVERVAAGEDVDGEDAQDRGDRRVPAEPRVVRR